MPANTDLIGRSGEPKRALLEFAQGPRFSRHVRAAIKERFGSVVVGDEGEVANFFDHLLLQHRLPDGRTMVDHFVSAHPELDERERAMLLGWKDVVEGIFLVQRRERATLIVTNLIDELNYRIRSNMGAVALAPMRTGTFLITRLVPLGSEWLLSGYSGLLPASAWREAREIAREFAVEQPALVFRNPQKLEQAWEMQRREHEEFVAFFGSDTVIIPGNELQERMQAYHHFRMYEFRDEHGRTPAERAEERDGVVPELPQWEQPDDLVESETVGVLYDKVEGLNLYPDFGLIDEAFATPRLASDRRHRETILGYLESDTIPPLPLCRLAERNPEHASQVFAQVLQRDFDWKRDGEALMRQYKPHHFERPPLPSVIPVSDSVIRDRVTEVHSKAPRPKQKGSGRKGRARGKKSRR